jgi:hypothetical protein
MIAHQSVADILRDHVRLSVEGIDRMYLNVYVPQLQSEQGVVRFFKYHRGQPLPSAALMSPLSRGFVAQLERFVARDGIALVQFRKGERKDAVVAEHLRGFAGEEGILFVGKAQEKTLVFRTEKRRSPTTGLPYPWIVRSSAMVNHYYVYAMDRDFGPFFLKFCSYFPFNAKLCINGHEYAKRQLAKEGIAFEALDNGVLSCADPARLQRICDGLSAAKIDALLRKWLRLLPHPFTGADRRAGYRYDLSILQAEFSLTQVLDKPQHGRQFFEQVIRENLDLGRPEQVQLIFKRRVQRNTPGLFRTRILTQDVTPSLHVYYKNTRIKQYHKESRALRTETTINNTRDFGVGKRLCACRGYLPGRQRPGCARTPARLRPALCRCAYPPAAGGHHPVPAAPRRLPLSRSAPASCGPVRPRPASDHSSRRHLSAAPSAPAWPDRAGAEELPLPRHPTRPARRLVLHARLQPTPATRPRSRASQPARHRHATPARLRSHRRAAPRVHPESPACRMKLDTFASSLLTQAGLV